MSMSGPGIPAISLLGGVDSLYSMSQYMMCLVGNVHRLGTNGTQTNFFLLKC